MKKRVLILVNHNVVIYNFRRELVERLISDGFEVYLSCPQGDRIPELISMGCVYYETDVDRRSKNPFVDLALIRRYKKLIRTIRPDLLLTYTIKPNIYGGIAARRFRVPQIATITGLGTAVENGGLLGRLSVFLYRFGLKKTDAVFFQNQSNLDTFKRLGVVKDNYGLLPGSGVNLDQHRFEPYPADDERVVFAIVGRIMRDKGTDEILYAAEKIKAAHPGAVFRLVGFYDEDYKDKVDSACKRGIVEYCGNQSDVHPYFRDCHAAIVASYHEGMSNVLLEAAATGRPVIATDIPGCRETFTPGVSGIAFRPADGDDLVRAIEKFIALSHGERAAMGLHGRERMEKIFDRRIVVERYIEKINLLT